ncbi:MAG: tRNA preQ1(34) S-adenosylmethionine ribosyltransferase-isomerase QueA [Pseudomonadales bacterium]|nr:tRNA preQ1(34) S-adenosylmethionine ribosyltransferase-isomerase QueA [Pseudomonadales bacterium]
MLHKNAFNYYLPKNRIAQASDLRRDQSKLLFINRKTNSFSDHYFYELPQILKEYADHPGVLMVRNNSQVIPARLFANKSTGGKVELLLIRDISESPDSPARWEVMCKPGLKKDDELNFLNGDLIATCIEVQENYLRVLEFSTSGEKLYGYMDQFGCTPIPPYVDESCSEDELRHIYQTTYASQPGSVAAPTAGLHFTHELTQKLKEYQIDCEEVTLHVGPGTFLGVQSDDVTKHHMHEEHFNLTPTVADKINKAKAAGKIILAVGTTTVRVLESCADKNGVLTPQESNTGIFIYPPYKYKVVSGLITNFHLPESTLLMLVSAYTSFPQTKQEFTDFKDNLMGEAYQHAIDNDYRFFSFGDGMLIL